MKLIDYWSAIKCLIRFVQESPIDYSGQQSIVFLKLDLTSRSTIQPEQTRMQHQTLNNKQQQVIIASVVNNYCVHTAGKWTYARQFEFKPL